MSQNHSKTKLLTHNFSQKTNKRICFYVLTVRKYLKFEMENQVSSTSGPSAQKKQINLFVCFLGEVTARQFSTDLQKNNVYLILSYDHESYLINKKKIFSELFSTHCGQQLAAKWPQPRPSTSVINPRYILSVLFTTISQAF